MVLACCGWIAALTLAGCAAINPDWLGPDETGSESSDADTNEPTTINDCSVQPSVNRGTNDVHANAIDKFSNFSRSEYNLSNNYSVKLTHHFFVTFEFTNSRPVRCPDRGQHHNDCTNDTVDIRPHR